MTDFSRTDAHGLWMRISYYEHPDPDMPSLTLLPMVHVGEPQFYDEMQDELWVHDTVYYESCYLPTPKLLRLFYKVIKWRARLAFQGDTKGKKDQVEKQKTASGLDEHFLTTNYHGLYAPMHKLRFVRADLHEAHARPYWQSISKWEWVWLFGLAGIGMTVGLIFNTRDYFSTSDAQRWRSPGDGFFARRFRPFYTYATEMRDSFLSMVLAEEIIDPVNRGKRLCVRYGQFHMPPLAETLLAEFDYQRIGYRDVLAVRADTKADISDVKTGWGGVIERIAAEHLRRLDGDTFESEAHAKTTHDEQVARMSLFFKQTSHISNYTLDLSPEDALEHKAQADTLSFSG